MHNISGYIRVGSFYYVRAFLALLGPSNKDKDFKDGSMVKPGFKKVPPQYHFEFASLFLHKLDQKKRSKFKIMLPRT